MHSVTSGMIETASSNRSSAPQACTVSRISISTRTPRPSRFGFGAMVSFALFSVWQGSDVDRLGLLGAQLTSAMAAPLPLLALEYIDGARTTWSSAALVEMVVAAALLANLLYMFGIARVGPARAGMFIHLVPLYGAIMSIAFLGERLHTYHAVGMLAIMAGLACSNLADRSEWPGQTKRKR